jgi:hypothetical protein
MITSALKTYQVGGRAVIRKEEVVVEVGWGGVSGRKREPGD